MRSLLFVPGDSPRKMDKAMDADADALIFDLEDSVAADAKAEARRIVRERLQAMAGTGRGERPSLYVRVNGLSTGLIIDDLDAVMPARPDGIMLPKAEGARDVQRLAAMIGEREAPFDETRGLTGILLVATETARGVLGLASYAGCSSRLEGISWGAEDLSADIGAEANRESDGSYTEPFRIVRTLSLLAAVAADADPIDSVFADFRNEEGLRRDCEKGVRDGFTGKLAIHPAQVPLINKLFAPSAESIESAERVVEAFRGAGSAGVVGLDGEMLDRPHLVRAEKLLARAAKYRD